MFVQVIQGRVSDREGLKRLGERWDKELRPGAAGFLGATIGLTDDDWLVNVVRFESEDAARANSDRPEQGEWWAEASKCFSAEPVFVESSDVELFQGGGSNDAGFVQAMIGSIEDRSKLASLEASMNDRLAELRPDLIGFTRIWHGDNEFVELAYFRSETEARENEAKELPADMQATWDEFQQLYASVTYRDLRDLILM